MNHRLYSLYHLTERLKIRFHKRFTPLGRIFFLVSGVAFLFGIGIQQSMIYHIFALMFCLIIFAFFLSLPSSNKLEIKRVLPETCVVGKPCRYSLKLKNPGKKAVQGLRYLEKADISLPTWQEFVSVREEGEEARNLFDRKMGYYRWLWLTRKKQRLYVREEELPWLPTGETLTVEMSFIPLRRGFVYLEGFSVVRIEPLGLCKAQRTISLPANLLVLPKMYPVPAIEMVGTRKYHQSGSLAVQQVGDSNEFLSLRQYSYGDPVKNIDWKTTARVGTVIVRQHCEEYFTRFALVVDTFTEKLYSDVLEEAISLACSLLTGQEMRSSMIDLYAVAGDKPSCISASRASDTYHLLTALASIPPCRTLPFSEMTKFISSSLHLLSSVVLVLINIDEERVALIDLLIGHRIPTKIFIITDNRADLQRKKEELQLSTPCTILEVENMAEMVGTL